MFLTDEGCDMFIESMSSRKHALFSRLAYVQGVRDSRRRKNNSGNLFPDYENEYTDGILAGMGMTFIDYIKFYINNIQYFRTLI